MVRPRPSIAKTKAAALQCRSWPRRPNSRACCAASWLGGGFRGNNQMDRIADQRITRVHAEIETIDYAGRLEADPLIGPRKFAGDLYVQADRPRYAEHGQVAGHPRKVLIAFFDAGRNEAHVRKSRHVEKDLAAQIIIHGRGVYVHGFCRDPKVCPAPGWPTKVDIDAALE